MNDDMACTGENPVDPLPVVASVVEEFRAYLRPVSMVLRLALR